MTISKRIITNACTSLRHSKLRCGSLDKTNQGFVTATATPKGNAEFDSWREGGVVVSREAEYTFAVENRNMTLKAYFTPNTDESGIEQIEAANEKVEVIYDLMGRRVKRAEKGLYIVNGKKVVLL